MGGREYVTTKKSKENLEAIETPVRFGNGGTVKDVERANTSVMDPNGTMDPVAKTNTDPRAAVFDDLSAPGPADTSESKGTLRPGLLKKVVTTEGSKAPLKNSTKKHGTLIVGHEAPLDFEEVSLHTKEKNEHLIATKVDGSVSGKGATTVELEE